MPTHRDQVFKKLGFKKDYSPSMEELAQKSGVPIKALQEVYQRGLNAYSHNLSSVRLKKDFSKNPNTTKYPASARLSAPQWGFARIYSFLNHGTTYKTTDSDIAKKYNV